VIAAIGSDEPGITLGRLTFSLQKYHSLEGNILGELIAKPAGRGRFFVFRETGEEVVMGYYGGIVSSSIYPIKRLFICYRRNFDEYT